MTKTKKPETKKPATKTMIDVTDSPDDLAQRHEFQDWFDRWGDQFGMRLPEFFGNRLPEFWGASREIGGVMRIEETVDDEGITIRGEIPGIDPDADLDITVEANRLNINAERRESKEKTEGGRHHSEFRYGAYRRSFPLPAGSTADDITASYTDGILEIRVPVQVDQAETTRVPVNKVS